MKSLWNCQEIPMMFHEILKKNPYDVPWFSILDVPVFFRNSGADSQENAQGPRSLSPPRREMRQMYLYGIFVYICSNTKHIESHGSLVILVQFILFISPSQFVYICLINGRSSDSLSVCQTVRGVQLDRFFSDSRQYQSPKAGWKPQPVLRPRFSRRRVFVLRRDALNMGAIGWWCKAASEPRARRPESYGILWIVSIWSCCCVSSVSLQCKGLMHVATCGIIDAQWCIGTGNTRGYLTCLKRNHHEAGNRAM